MAQIANSETEKITGTIKIATNKANKAVDATHEAAGTAEDIVRRGAETVQRTVGAVSEAQRETAHQTAEGVAELGQILVEMLNQQTRHNVEMLNTLSGAVNWREIAEIQNAFVRESFERTAAFSRRYVELVQTLLTSATSTLKDQAGKVA